MLPLLVQVDNTEAKTSSKYEFPKSPVRIGRNLLNDIPLEQGFVSQWHGIVRFDAAGIHYFDLGSTNGTFIDGRRLEKNVPVPLNAIEVLQIGAVRLTFRRGSELPDELMPPPASVVSAWAEAVLDAEPAKTLALFGRTEGGKALLDPRSIKPLLARPARSALPPAGAAHQNLGHGSAAEAPARQGATRLHARRSDAPPGMSPPAGVSSRLGEMLDQFARKHLPSEKPAPHTDDPEALLERVLAVVEAFSMAFVALRKGYEQFGSEVGVRTIHGSSPLHTVREGGEALAYLLDSKSPTVARIHELTGIFAEFGIHEVAMMQAFTEGVKSLLDRLDPNEIGADGSRRKWRPFSDKSQWKEYGEHFTAITSDDHEIQAAVFGPEFARAYATVAGEGANTSHDKKGPPKSGRRT